MAGTYSLDDLLLALLIETRISNKLRVEEVGNDADDLDAMRTDMELVFGNGSSPYTNSTLSAANTTE